jgi:aldose 1-epimerase
VENNNASSNSCNRTGLASVIESGMEQINYLSNSTITATLFKSYNIPQHFELKTVITIGACILFLLPYESRAQSMPKGFKDGIIMQEWGEADGKKVSLYSLTNKKGTEVKITNYGATITSWITKDKAGNSSNIVLGFDSLKNYLAQPPFFGATVGRYGNRIGNAQFTIDGTTYKLVANNGKHQLHGGPKGFDKVVWDADNIRSAVPSLTLRYFSKDGEGGYPGNLKASVKFTLTSSDELQIEYNAETDKATPINLTNHSYFNLSGNVDNTILEETLLINANMYTPVDNTAIPTGEIKPVKGTPFDFTTAHTVGKFIDSVRGGYDHNFVLNRKGKSLQKAAAVYDERSGRSMEVFTTEPGIQFYTGNALSARLRNRDGKPLKRYAALCLETQHFPDSPNKPSFPSTILRPREKYHSITKYKVTVK